jgi:four helix bundle protein
MPCSLNLSGSIGLLRAGPYQGGPFWQLQNLLGAPQGVVLRSARRFSKRHFNNNRERETKGKGIMAKYQQFEDLPVWQESGRLYHAVVDLLEEPNLRISTGFRHQLERAALAVSSHIAETFERFTLQDRQASISMAREACGDVRAMMSLVKDRPAFQGRAPALQNIQALAESVARQLGGWSASMDKMSTEGRRPQPEKERGAAEEGKRPEPARSQWTERKEAPRPGAAPQEARGRGR